MLKIMSPYNLTCHLTPESIKLEAFTIRKSKSGIRIRKRRCWQKQGINEPA